MCLRDVDSFFALESRPVFTGDPRSGCGSGKCVTMLLRLRFLFCQVGTSQLTAR